MFFKFSLGFAKLRQRLFNNNFNFNFANASELRATVFSRPPAESCF